MQHDPDAWYTLDSERDATQSEICRQGKGKAKECLIVRFLPVVLSPKRQLTPNCATPFFSFIKPSFPLSKASDDL
jgi:hypothetical protein